VSGPGPERRRPSRGCRSGGNAGFIARHLWREAETADHQMPELGEAQGRYTKRVQAYVRKREREMHGLKHRPNAVEVGHWDMFLVRPCIE